MSILYSGGLWTVFLILAMVSGYVWVLGGPRWAYKTLGLVAIVVIFSSQLLPEAHVFRIRVFEGLYWWFWATMIAIPVIAYSMLVRWIKQKASARYDA